MNSWVAILAALGAAISFACAANFQQEATETVPKDDSLRLHLLLDLLHRPKWLIGISLLLVGYGLQALALSYGPVALVQPIVVTELAIAIPLAIWRRHQQANTRDWVGIIFVLGGVATFLLLASPSQGIPDPGATTWIASLTPVGLLIAVLVAFARRLSGPRRAMVLGSAAGLAFGIISVLTKSTTYLLSNHLAAAFTSWQLYLVVVFGILALVISQSAYQAGPLSFSMPLIGVLEPLVAVIIGDTALKEQVQLSSASLVLESLAAMAAALGIVLLSTSPTVISVYASGR